VQWDIPPDGITIYRFVDEQSGALIADCEVPSEEVLSVAHGIAAQLQKEETDAAAAASSEAGGNSHGH